MNPNERHQLIVGGLTLVSDGKVVTVTSPVCVYDHLTPANVQEFWNIANRNLDFLEAMSAFTLKVSSILIEIGNERNLPNPTVRTGSAQALNVDGSPLEREK